MFSLAGVEAAGDRPRETDTSVAGIFLEDPDSGGRILGSTPRPSEPPGKDDFPVLEVCSASRREVLTLVFHYGGIANSYSEFRVRSVREAAASCAVALKGVGQFVTGKGVRLGISRKKLAALLGTRFSENRKGTETVIRYELTDREKSPFLRRYNQAAYFGVYRFRGSKLAGFEFGFIYP